MSKLDDVINKIRKDYSKNVIGNLEETKKKYSSIPFRTLSLSYLFRGGMPRTIIELVGLPAAGKSSLSYSLCGAAQKTLKQEWEDEVNNLQSLEKPSKEQKERLEYLNERGYQRVLYIDVEYCSNTDWMEDNGVCVEELLYIRPDGQSAEQIFQMILDLIASDGIGMVVLDSIPALVSQQAMTKTMEEKTYCGISGPLSSFCSKLLPLCNKHNCLFVGINQQRDDLGGWNRIITPGGRMWTYTCSVRLLLKKGEYYDDKYSILKAHPEKANGNMVEVEVIKNKATKPDRRMCKFSITYDKGIDGYNDTINLSLALGIIKQAGAWYSIMDENGEIKENNGEPLKFQGLLRLRSFLDGCPGVYEELYNRVMKKICED